MRDLKKYRGRTVVVSARGITARGVLESAGGVFISLSGATAVRGELGNVPVDGVLLIPVAEIEYIQAVS